MTALEPPAEPIGPPSCSYFGASKFRRFADRLLLGARASRSLEDLDDRVEPRVRAFLQEASERGLSLFVYTTFRPLDEQAQAAESGVSWTRRGWHNLRDPETGAPAARAIDYAFRHTTDPWSPAHRWDEARFLGERNGAVYEVWHKGDLGHAVWTLDEMFRDAWTRQARHHAKGK